MKPYFLFLDDTRIASDAFKYSYDKDYITHTWNVVRNYRDFVAYVTKWYDRGCWPEIISFDHDLGCGEEMESKKTGKDCANWLVDFCMDKVLPLPHFKVHSMNTVGRDNIAGILQNFSDNWPVAPKALNFTNKTYKP